MKNPSANPWPRRVLLVVANREDFPEPAFPAGALYVAGAVEAAGGEVRVFDAGAYRRPLPALRAVLAAFGPDVVGLSLRNADNAAWPHTNTYTAWYQRVTAAVREAAPLTRHGEGGGGGERGGGAYWMSWTPIASLLPIGPSPTGPRVTYRTNQPAMQLLEPLPAIGIMPACGWQAGLFELLLSEM